MIMRKLIMPLLFLLFISSLFAGIVIASSVFNDNRVSPVDELLNQLGLIYGLLGALMMFMIVLAAAAYIVAQFFGAETRAKITVWSQGMLVAVGVSALIILMMYFIVPNFMSGGTDQIIAAEMLITNLRDTVAMSLSLLIFVLLILAAVVYAFGQLNEAQTRARATVWATGLLSGAIIAAVIYVLLFQILTQFQSTLFQGTPLFPYRDVVVNVTFFAAFLVLVTYLISKVFKVPEWEAYLNIELSNIMLSFVLMLFIIGMFGVGTAVASLWSGGVAETPPQAAIAYMRITVADSALRAISDVYTIQICASMLSTLSKRIGEYVLTQSFKLFPGMDTFVSITNVLALGLVMVYGSISAQISLLYLVDGTMVNFVLPAGLILRFFPPTRDAGAFLISLAFGFQIIFPTSYIINKTIYAEIGATPYQSPYLLIASICGPFKYGVWGALLNTNANPIFSYIPGGMVIGNMLAGLVSESTLNFVSMAEFIPILRHLSLLSLLALFIPAFSMMITISFINMMTKFIVAKV